MKKGNQKAKPDKASGGKTSSYSKSDSKKLVFTIIYIYTCIYILFLWFELGRGGKGKGWMSTKMDGGS